VLVKLLALVTVLVSCADHWTTYLCLRQNVAGWDVTEANPIADWLFGTIGLVPGLLLDSAVTVAAVTFLVATRTIPRLVKWAFFAGVIAVTAFAVWNNLQAVEALGLSPWGV
jgi:hypothetical protein